MFNVTRWNPLEELTNLHSEMDSVFGSSWRKHPAGSPCSWVPATEIAQGKEGWTLRIALPGINPEYVQVEVDQNLLTISGERTLKEENPEQHMSEISYGQFERAFRLPDNIAAEKVNANFENGMLELRLPINDAAKPRRIEIGKTSSAKAA